MIYVCVLVKQNLGQLQLVDEKFKEESQRAQETMDETRRTSQSSDIHPDSLQDYQPAKSG